MVSAEDQRMIVAFVAPCREPDSQGPDPARLLLVRLADAPDLDAAERFAAGRRHQR
jgi:hypothetical protein